jgi:phospholipid-transporting ATPase
MDRSIYSNVPDEEIPNNKIETSKYNYFTFLPLNIIDQFSKLSNSTKFVI